MNVDPAVHSAPTRPRRGQALGQQDRAHPTRPGEAVAIGHRSPGAQLRLQHWLGLSLRGAPSVGKAGPPGELWAGSGGKAFQSHTDLPVPELSQPAGTQPQEPTKRLTTHSRRHGPQGLCRVGSAHNCVRGKSQERRVPPQHTRRRGKPRQECPYTPCHKAQDHVRLKQGKEKYRHKNKTQLKSNRGNVFPTNNKGLMSSLYYKTPKEGLEMISEKGNDSD